MNYQKNQWGDFIIEEEGSTSSAVALRIENDAITIYESLWGDRVNISAHGVILLIEILTGYRDGFEKEAA